MQTTRSRRAQTKMIERLCRLIEANPDRRIPLSRLSHEAGLSQYHLQRTFKRIVGVSPRQYAESVRLKGLKASLRRGEEITPALYGAGFGSSSRLYERAPRRLGMTPGTYRRGGRGMMIRYTIVGSPLGRLMVAGTDRGICAVNLGGSDRSLEGSLRREFPQAEIRPGRSGLTRWVSKLVHHLEGRQPRLDLPLDVRGTAFQIRVWEELLRIPYGETRTYGQIARAVGRPRAARAVGRACATNPAPLVIPCHRVVGSSGDLTGYGLGISRKKALLKKESGE
jgi:AraC family transcriptional regulator of adaptative response/methylated-DNA-[protein]-cysteine methyltransferase